MTLSSNFDAVTANLPALIGRQVGYAALRTVNDMAFSIKQEVDHKMETTFHKPTRFTMSAIRVLKEGYGARETVNIGGIPARVPRTTYTAYVGLAQAGMLASARRAPVRITADDAWERALKHQFGGGGRRFTRWEATLHKADLIPAGHYVIPARGCPLDAYDNPVHGFMIQLLSYFKAFKENGFRANMDEKGKKRLEKRLGKKWDTQNLSFFIVREHDPNRKGKQLHPGIWQRTGTSGNTQVKPLFIFVPKVSYQQLIPFGEIARTTIEVLLPDIFAENLLKAIKNDRQIGRIIANG